MIAAMTKKTIKAIPPLHSVLVSARQFLYGRDERAKQHFRDYCRRLPDLVEDAVFVKVGANDGVTGDPCSDILLADRRWRGLLIEPVPYCFNRLKANFSDAERFSLERVAIGPVVDTTTFYYVDERARAERPELPDWFDQLGSFDRSHIVKHLDGVLEPYILKAPVEVCPLGAVILRNRLTKIDLLHIDTEGYDFEVLKTLNFSKYKPPLIYIEHQHLPALQKKDMLRLLVGQGYRVRDAGRDYFALNERAIVKSKRL